MRQEVVLITGANGEIGHSLIEYLGKEGKYGIIALDVSPIDEALRPYCLATILGDILDQTLLGRLVANYEIRTIYHLASILSTKAEYNPEMAHRVNVEGTLNLLKLAVDQANWQGKPVKFIYPSSIAVYGLPAIEIKMRAGKVTEDQYLNPTTMYGINKLYCENLGRYYTHFYRRLAADRSANTIDFRGLRFPGLISAMTVPTGGTSDYGPEMLHHAAQNLPYHCFVRADSVLPFMAMPDAVRSILMLEQADKDRLSRLVYNVTSFNPSAGDIKDLVLNYFPQANIDFVPHEARQSIVDSWPGDVDDSAARTDWDWAPEYDQHRSFEEYLIPAVKERYRKS
ncbi:MAG TPA: NAD-dependent epimerase/dehydratase family protein [Bellilinea sp.]|nr:NAD-dependent epimerase/dehydratase family protein [Bellilinea sp.]